MERKILAGLSIKYLSIPAGKFRRYQRGIVAEALDVKTNAHNFRDFFKFIKGSAKAYKLLKKIKPDAVFIKGGYVGLPVGIAARWLKIGFFLHESDVVLGLANKMLSKKATAIGVGFPLEAYKGYGLRNLVFVGSPLRDSVLKGNQAAARAHFNIDEKKPIILVFGSSRGSTPINQVIFDNISLIAKKYTILHITGEDDIERARFLQARLDDSVKGSYKPYSFLKQEMGLAYALCHIAVSRAGANSLAELAAWRKPAIIIPRPGATNDHQNANAQFMSRQGAISVLPQSSLTTIRLLSEIDRLMAHPQDREYLSKNIAKFARPQAAKTMAKLIIESIKD